MPRFGIRVSERGYHCDGLPRLFLHLPCPAAHVHIVCACINMTLLGYMIRCNCHKKVSCAYMPVDVAPPSRVSTSCQNRSFPAIPAGCNGSTSIAAFAPEYCHKSSKRSIYSHWRVHLMRQEKLISNRPEHKFQSFP